MNRVSLIIVLFTIIACGGGSGGGGDTPAPPPTPAPGVSFSATPTSVLLNNTSTFSWSTTNATSCTASGSTQWSGSKATSGTEDIPITISGNTTFTLSCSGAGGSRNASVTVEGYRQTDGVVVDGYISGADVFIDENANFIADAQENATTSDNDGKFTIKYANGSLVSIGGTDLDSQTLLDNLLITHKLDGYSDFKAITPVTSVDAFLESVDVNAALGIDSSINVGVDDPVALKGDGGIYDYLYEKGNQLTVLAYALQNITNDLNTTTETTQDFFKSIAEEVETEYTQTQVKVDIETEAFITKALDNVINIKSLNIEETAKQNTLKALSGVLPIIEVKSSDDLTTSVIRFGVGTLQEDIKAIANGTADENKVASYTTDVIKYIAEDQGISSDEITPDITAIDDNPSTDEDTSIIINVLANDSFITTSPISIDASNGDNGTVGVTKSSPPQITYSPNSDYFGNDLFTYTITQGDKTSSAEVEVDINPINDVPSIDIASTLSIPENQTAITTVSVSDPDEDDLTLTLSGEDANSLNLTSENVLSFKEEPDFETKAAYSINLSLTDGEETVDKDINIVITNVNDIAPVFTSEATFSAAENQTAIGTVTATDAEGDDVTFTVSGDDLAITSAGVLTFASEPDFETKTSYTATVTATDGTNPTTQDITINITNVNDIAPVFTSEATFSAAENQTAIGTVTATDAEGDDVTFTVSGDDLAITSAGVLTFASEPDFETKTSYTATVTATDGTNPTTQDITINITNVNDIAPVFTSEATFSAAENQTAIGTVTATDAEGDDVTFTVSGDDLAITSAGVLTFASEPDFETKTSYTATVTATDGTNPTTQDITINITNVNDIAPVFTSEATFSAAENQTAIGTVTATDAEGDDVTFTVSGDDLAITSAGVLTFASEPDFETKTSYTATVTATDGTNPTTQDITINITNVNDIAPVFTSEATFSAAENQTAIGTVTATDAEGDDVTFTVSGDDLAITSAGVLTFASEPDFETKTSYTATVTATDGTNPTTQDITVSVLDVDEIAPVLTVTGDNPATVELGASYTDAGATSDDGSTVKTTGTVDTNTVGSYTLTYSATDAAGNTGTATRTVNVVDTIAPVITVTGDNPATVILGATYVDSGAIADDGSTVKTTGTVDTNTVGSYTLTYSATDAAGNTGTATRTVTVQLPPPEFGINGRAVKGVVGGATITVVDSAGADVAIASGGSTNADGSYTIIFDQAEVSAPIVVTVAGGDGSTMVCDIDLAGTDDDCAVGDGTSVAFGESYPLPATFALRGLVAEVPTEDGASATVNITPASDLATNLALESADNSELTAADVEGASSQVLNLIQTITGTDLSGQDLNDIAIPDVADSSDTAAASTSSLALAAFSAAIIANQGEGETVGDVIARVNASLSANAEGNLVGSGTELSSLANSVVTALTTVSAQVTAGGGDSSAVDAATESAKAIEETYESIGDEDVAVDTTAPIITIIGDNPITLERGTSYIEVGASADGGETVITSGTVNTSTVGTYKITYSASDGFNTGTATRTVNVVDTADPVITVTGDNPVTVELGATYTDAGAVAVDFGQSIDVSSSSTLDTSSVGSYKVTYSATDSSGNTSTVTRTINVVDTTKPIVIVNGANPTIVELGDVYSDEGATTSDFGIVTLSEDSDVNSLVIGTYSVVYTATDASGNSAFATRTVLVVDTTAPVITITGDNPATVELGASYTDEGATADDGSTVTSTSIVDTSTVGTYTVTYSATDAAGNEATEVVRTVNVVDTTAPVITITGDNPATVELGASYTDEGATADDGSTVTSTSIVDTSTVGTYTVTYSATDAAGNEATEVVRTVNVVDTLKPVVTPQGADATIELGGTYTEAGATASDTSGTLAVVVGGDTVDTSTVGTYTVTYSATDASGNKGTASITIKVEDTTAPVIITSNLSAVENQKDVGFIEASDLQQIEYSSSSSEITINSSTGEILFKNEPDYELQSTYSVEITATDLSGNYSTKIITINITNDESDDPVEGILLPQSIQLVETQEGSS